MQLNQSISVMNRWSEQGDLGQIYVQMSLWLDAGIPGRTEDMDTHTPVFIMFLLWDFDKTDDCIFYFLG